MSSPTLAEFNALKTRVRTLEERAPVPGPQGLAGPMGPQGPIGPTGAQGAPGETGAVGSAGERGVVGPPGEAGQMGPPGERGETGPTGQTGPTGLPGAAGPQGPMGSTGPQGPPGAPGAKGATGPTGPQGPPGKNAEPGPEPPPNREPRIPAGSPPPYSAACPFNVLRGAPAGTTYPSPTPTELDARSTILVGTGPGAASYDYEHPVYVARESDPVYSCAVGSVRVPPGAKPAAGTDGHLTILEPWVNRQVDFWRASLSGTTIHSSAAAELPIDGNGLSATPCDAASVGLRAGVITAQEFVSGNIPHALFAVFNHTNGFVAPAKQTSSTTAGWPPMGQRFALSEIHYLKTPPSWVVGIATALHEYGLIPCDNGGGLFKVESSLARAAMGEPDPLVEYAKSLGIPQGTSSGGEDYTGTYLFNFKGYIDWSKLVATK